MNAVIVQTNADVIAEVARNAIAADADVAEAVRTAIDLPQELARLQANEREAVEALDRTRSALRAALSSCQHWALTPSPSGVGERASQICRVCRAELSADYRPGDVAKGGA